MAKRFGRHLLVLALFSSWAVWSITPAAGENPAGTMQSPEEKTTAAKRLLVAQNLVLSATEARGFWPLYDEYQDALKELHNRTLQIISSYADDFETLSDESAKRFLEDFIALQQGQVDLLTTFLLRFRKVLPGFKIARYYQLENKINAIVHYRLVARIPLAG